MFAVAVAGLVVAGVAFGQGDEAPPKPESPAPSNSIPPVACDGDKPSAPDPQTYERPEEVLQPGVDYRAALTTSCGVFEIDLLEKSAPRTVNNFIFLAREGFYEGLQFHRVEQNSIIQGGEPNGDGTGGPGYTIPDEYPASPEVYKFGAVGMANRGPNTAGSEFFVVVHDPPIDLDEADLDDLSDKELRVKEKDAREQEAAGYRPDYAVFGKIDLDDAESIDTLTEIWTQPVQVGNDPSIATRPKSPVFIESIEIIET